MKILEIGNYPPPMCGWAIHTKLLVEEIRRRGHVCDVLKLNEGRREPSTEYIPVMGATDYALKVVRAALRGYTFNIHLNAESWKMYLMTLYALIVARAVRRPAALTFHGGLPQTYFPSDSPSMRLAFRSIFQFAGKILCDSEPISRAIESYGIPRAKITAIEPFAPEYMCFEHVTLAADVQRFIDEHRPVFFCYLSFRPEYRLDVLREGMRLFRERHGTAGFIWVGFPAKELQQAKLHLQTWESDEASNVLLLGNLTHDEFLTLVSRCTATLRTPACDGVSASILESIALGVPVVASENGRRPEGVITYRERDAADMSAKLDELCRNYENIRKSLKKIEAEDNVRRAADWLLSPFSGAEPNRQ